MSAVAKRVINAVSPITNFIGPFKPKPAPVQAPPPVQTRTIIRTAAPIQVAAPQQAAPKQRNQPIQVGGGQVRTQSRSGGAGGTAALRLSKLGRIPSSSSIQRKSLLGG